MEADVGLDVSQKSTAVCVVDRNGNTVWRGTAASNPQAIDDVIQQLAPEVRRVGMETGPLAVWLYLGPRDRGVRVDCIHARHVQTALATQLSKTDSNDAHGIAQLTPQDIRCCAASRYAQHNHVQAAKAPTIGQPVADEVHRPVLVRPRWHIAGAICAARGVTVGTARHQLKQVLAKTGSNRQSDIVRRVLCSAAAHVVDCCDSQFPVKVVVRCRSDIA